MFSNTERLALAGFLAGYTGLTREAYALDLRQFASWCQLNHVQLFGVRRADIECFSRDLEAKGRARATVTVAAGLGPAAEHALMSLLALNGLRVSEATGADIQSLGLERGHRTLTIRRKGGKIVTIPLAPRTARAIDLTIGERCQGPIFITPGGGRLDRHGAGRIVHRVAGRAGITKTVGPHTLRHAFIIRLAGRGQSGGGRPGYRHQVPAAVTQRDPKKRPRSAVMRAIWHVLPDFVLSAERALWGSRVVGA